MKRVLFFISFFVCTVTATAQNTSDSGSFYLHKFAQNIGKETYTVTRNGNNITYDINFKFVDRGSPVPLKAQLVTTKELEPLSLFIKGNTSRFSTINDTIRINNKKATVKVDSAMHDEMMKPLAFPVAGYSPGTVQMLLLKYWKLHKEPQSIPMLPNGKVLIKRMGKDTLHFMGNNVLLDRFVLNGLVWGNEIVWTDQNGNLICLITNDAEGDKLEMMSVPYETLLPELISKAATYGMQLFTNSMRMNVAKNKTMYIIGGNVLDMNTQSYIKHATIIIENGIIKAIDSTPKRLKNGGLALPPPSATIIHAEGKTIVPGLWDMHAHFEQAEWGPAYLAAGVTTVRDCGNEFVYINAIKAAIDSHKGVGPLILKAGIIDGPGPFGLGIVRVSTPEQGVNAVRMYKDNGFAQIKIYSSIQPAVLKAITTEAHRLNLTVTGHIPEGMTTKAGIDSGMDMINHISYIYGMMKKNKDRSVDINDSLSGAALGYLQSHHVVVDPTVGVYEMIFRSVDDDILHMEPNYYNLPVPLQALFTNMGQPAAQAKASAPRFKSMLDLVKVLHDKGVPIVAGTDMGFPGYSVARELELYVMAGLTPFEAIQSATITPAQVMHLDNVSGSIAPGKQADLVILDANPLTEIRNIRKVFLVIKDGQQYDPSALHKMVGFVK